MFSSYRGIISASGSSSGWFDTWNGSVDGSNSNSGQSATQAVVIALSATRFMLVAPSSTQESLWGIVGTISGTSISWGSVVDLDGGGAPASTNIRNPNICVLDAGKLLITYGRSSNTIIYAVVVNVSGASISAGDVFQIVSGADMARGGQQLTTLSTTTALCAYRDIVNGETRGVVLTISGTAILPDSPASIISATPRTPAVLAYDTNKVLLVYAANSTAYPTARIVNISGTSIGTLGSTVTIESTAVFNTNTLHIAPINASTALVTYDAGSGASLRACVLSLSGNAVSANTPAAVTTGATNLENAWLERLNSTEYMASYFTNSAPPRAKSKVIRLSGVSIEAGSEVQIQASDAGTAGQNISKISDDIVINGVVSSSTAYAKVLRRAT